VQALNIGHLPVKSKKLSGLKHGAREQVRKLKPGKL